MKNALVYPLGRTKARARHRASRSGGEGLLETRLTKQRKATRRDSLSKRGHYRSIDLSNKNIPVSKSTNPKGKSFLDREKNYGNLLI